MTAATAPKGKKTTPRGKKTPARGKRAPDPKNLKGGAAKLAWMQAEIVRQVEKTGRNQHHNYDYFQEHGILQIIKPLLVKCGAGVSTDFPPDDVSYSGDMVYGSCCITVFDPSLPPADPMFGITERYPCAARDNQDKGPYKMQTQGVKYAMQKCFKIPTEALEDVDADESGQAASPAPAAPKAARPQDLAKLRADAQELVQAGKIQPAVVTGYLTSTFGKAQFTELTADEAKEARKQVTKWKA